MDNKEEIIREIEQKIKELDYPGTSINNGVYAIFDGDNVLGVYYPEKNCVLIYPDKIIQNIYSYKQAAAKVLHKK